MIRDYWKTGEQGLLGTRGNKDYWKTGVIRIIGIKGVARIIGYHQGC